MAKVLLDHGADVAAADNDGVTALLLSFEGGHVAVGMPLLDSTLSLILADF